MTTLWVILIGYFMIAVDSSIVLVANPSIMAELNTDYGTVIWVTTSYALAYAVPSLVAGRLGDRFRVKNLYLIGLALFTAASLWCGLSDGIVMLIAARAAQGLGAAVVNAQILTIVTLVFPVEHRGTATSIWSVVASVGFLIGPLAGGVLVEMLGWQWIFFVNVPIGVVGLALTARFVPSLPTRTHRFDLIGVALSGTGLFLVVFAIQEGQAVSWAPWIWAMVFSGAGFMLIFICWLLLNTREPLIPIHIFGYRNFTLCSLGAALMGFAMTAVMLPGMFYVQSVYGFSPIGSVLLIAPISVAAGLLAPLVGKFIDRHGPRLVVGCGFSVVSVALTWLSIEMTPTTPVWRLILPNAALGAGIIFVWPALAANATRDLPPSLVAAGSGVYATFRSFGEVLGSALMAAWMTSRIAAEVPAAVSEIHAAVKGATEHAVLQLPGFLREPFSVAMSQAMLLPALIALIGVGVAGCMNRRVSSAVRSAAR
ncbi:DHA2 family efflux MFS transporter permease subunit [Mycobacterium camsae]|uniref:DHA2 family efflux MFS transporter permease subunit n=1 Tax=Mycobacterium gordonae TaxID=1778 RepID=UPI001982610E|nr:DHA2 family efflux MFS transporter permease subunit [Mycobacterium gordonae]